VLRAPASACSTIALGEDLDLVGSAAERPLRSSRFIVPFPTFFPNVPSIDTLGGQPAAPKPSGGSMPACTRRMSFNPPSAWTRQLPQEHHHLGELHQHARACTKLALAGYQRAPLPVTLVRPFGAGDIYLYESSGIFNQNQLITNVKCAVLTGRVTLFGYFTLGKRKKSDTDSAGVLPGQPVRSEKTNTAGLVSIPRSALFMGWAVVTAAAGRAIFSPFISVKLGGGLSISPPGRDLNGDGLFQRQALRSPPIPARPSIHTPWGDFDPNPIPGETIIPRNYGQGPGQVFHEPAREPHLQFRRQVRGDAAGPVGGRGAKSTFGGGPRSGACRRW